jgi:hypothetical protein
MGAGQNNSGSNLRCKIFFYKLEGSVLIITGASSGLGK